MNNLELWEKVERPPEDALKTIGGGRLRGMTDINPQWRYRAITEIYGPIGFNWKYTVDRLWLEPADKQIAAFAIVSFYYKLPGTDKWSEAIIGTGGSMFLAQESSGLRVSDEAFKMAVTDALSVAMKMIGVGSLIYEGRFDGKYGNDENEFDQRVKKTPYAPFQKQLPTTKDVNTAITKIGQTEYENLTKILKEKGINARQWKAWLFKIYGINSASEIRSDAYEGVLKTINEHLEQITGSNEAKNELR